MNEFVNWAGIIAFIGALFGGLDKLYDEEKKIKFGIWLISLENAAKNPNKINEVVSSGVNYIFGSNYFGIRSIVVTVFITTFISVVSIIFICSSYEIKLGVFWVIVIPLLTSYSLVVSIYSLPSDFISMLITRVAIRSKSILIYILLAPIDFILSIATTSYLFVILNLWFINFLGNDSTLPIIGGSIEESSFYDRYRSEEGKEDLGKSIDNYNRIFKNLEVFLGVKIPEGYTDRIGIDSNWDLVRMGTVAYLMIPSLIFSALTSLTSFFCYLLSVVASVLNFIFQKVFLNHFGFKMEEEPFYFSGLVFSIIFSIFYLVYF